MNSQIDEFINKAKIWGVETRELRRVILECGLEEELKWAKPCYSFDNKNIVIIQGFKKYLALLFFKGYLLKNTQGILVKTGENTVVGRQIRFSSLQEIQDLETPINEIILEALEIEKTGLDIDLTQERKLELPEEFQKKLQEYPELNLAFEKLSPGRQKSHILQISSAKQSKTRESRIESIPFILKGKGFNEL